MDGFCTALLWLMVLPAALTFYLLHCVFKVRQRVPMLVSLFAFGYWSTFSPHVNRSTAPTPQNTLLSCDENTWSYIFLHQYGPHLSVIFALLTLVVKPVTLVCRVPTAPSFLHTLSTCCCKYSQTCCCHISSWSHTFYILHDQLLHSSGIDN